MTNRTLFLDVPDDADTPAINQVLAVTIKSAGQEWEFIGRLVAPTDTEVVDAIANLMRGTEWNADTTDAIANLIGTVREHPGLYDPNFDDGSWEREALNRDAEEQSLGRPLFPNEY